MANTISLFANFVPKCVCPGKVTDHFFACLLKFPIVFGVKFKRKAIMFPLPFGGSPAGSGHYHHQSHFEKRRQSAGNLSVAAAQRRRKRMMTRTPWTSAGGDGEGSSATRLLSKLKIKLRLLPRFSSFYCEWSAFSSFISSWNANHRNARVE